MKRISFVLLIGLFLITSAAAQMNEFNARGKVTQEMNDEGLSIRHPQLNMNQKVKVVNTVTGKEIEATVVGRVPASNSRIADVSAGVWQELGLSPDTDVRIWFRNVATRPPPAETPPPPAEEPPSVAAEKPPEPAKEEPAPEPEPEPSAETAKAEPDSSGGDDGSDDKQPYNITVNTYVNTDEKSGIQTPYGYGGTDADFLAWLTAMLMDSRDSRDYRDARESREVREARESRDSRDIREARERELRDAREARERELRDAHEAREREARREAREAKDDREQRDREARLAREREREAREREARASRERPPQVTQTPQPPSPPPQVVPPPAPPQALPENPSVYHSVDPSLLYPIQPLRPLSIEEMQIIPGIPDPNSGKTYRIQVASFSLPQAAAQTIKILEAVGFHAVHERHESMYRVVVVNIHSSMAYAAIQKLGALGIRQVWVRE